MVEFEELILSTAITDIHFSHGLIYQLLGHYFIENPIYLEVNKKIQKLIKAVMVISKLKFRPEFLLRSLRGLGIPNKLESLKKNFLVYLPCIRGADNSTRVSLLKEISNNDRRYLEEIYNSSINFWSDIVEIAKLVDHGASKAFKRLWIMDKLEEVNKGLPSFVYIPSSSKN